MIKKTKISGQCPPKQIDFHKKKSILKSAAEGANHDDQKEQNQRQSRADARGDSLRPLSGRDLSSFSEGAGAGAEHLEEFGSQYPETVAGGGIDPDLSELRCAGAGKRCGPEYAQMLFRTPFGLWDLPLSAGDGRTASGSGSGSGEEELRDVRLLLGFRAHDRRDHRPLHGGRNPGDDLSSMQQLQGVMPSAGKSGSLRTFVDYRALARAAVRHLVARGHRKIGIIAGSEKDFLYSEMLAGFRGALAEENVLLNPEWVISGLGYEQAADQVGVLVRKLRGRELPTAFFTVRDYRASWLYEAAKRLELVIPKDISVISFDNHSWKGAEANGLTTFDEPLRAQGEAAVELLRSWVATGKRPESLEFKPELVERSSIREIIG